MSDEFPSDDEFRDIRSAWVAVDSRSSKKEPTMLVHELHQLKAKQSATVRKRDLTENLAALFVIFFFGRWAITTNDLNQQIGASIVVVSAIVVMVVMWCGRRTFTQADMASTPREACELQLKAVERQQRMLRSVPIWYITPMGIGVVWIAFSMMKGAFLLGYLTVCAILFVGITYLNSRAARVGLQPEIDKLSEMLSDLAEPDADQTGENGDKLQQ